VTDPTTGRRPGPGQPTKLTPEVHARIVEVVAAGNYLKTAAQFAGVSVSTLTAWMARGRAAAALADRGEPVPEEEQRYLAFMGAVAQAETQAEVAAVVQWRRAFPNDWRAARDYLGRKRPEQWAPKTTISITTEEAEARIEQATLEALTALGVDTDGATLDVDDPANVTDALPGPDEDWSDTET
jgi:hypothetical protein